MFAVSAFCVKIKDYEGIFSTNRIGRRKGFVIIYDFFSTATGQVATNSIFEYLASFQEYNLPHNKKQGTRRNRTRQFFRHCGNNNP